MRHSPLEDLGLRLKQRSRGLGRHCTLTPYRPAQVTPSSTRSRLTGAQGSPSTHTRRPAMYVKAAAVVTRMGTDQSLQ